MIARRTESILRRTLCAVALALLSSACGLLAQRPASSPKRRALPYPIVLDYAEDRRERALASWAQLVRSQGINNPPSPELHPITSTIIRLPALTSPLRLPHIGAREEMDEEELREAARRFLSTVTLLLGADPNQLSLISIDKRGEGFRLRYRQVPFTYPLGDGFGVVEIGVRSDGRLIELSSSAIPEAERAQAPLAEIQTELAARIAKTTPDGKQGTSIRRLVIYPIARAPRKLELHLAWEAVASDRGAFYIDALTGETLGRRASDER